MKHHAHCKYCNAKTPNFDDVEQLNSWLEISGWTHDTCPNCQAKQLMNKKQHSSDFNSEEKFAKRVMFLTILGFIAFLVIVYFVKNL